MPAAARALFRGCLALGYIYIYSLMGVGIDQIIIAGLGYQDPLDNTMLIG
jgi:hypothetical protein